MKIIVFFKNVFAGIMLLTPSFLFAQDKLILNEGLPVYAEKLDLIFENHELLGIPVYILGKTKSNVKVGNYGLQKLKEGALRQEERQQLATLNLHLLKQKLNFPLILLIQQMNL